MTLWVLPFKKLQWMKEKNNEADKHGFVAFFGNAQKELHACTLINKSEVWWVYNSNSIVYSLFILSGFIGRWHKDLMVILLHRFSSVNLKKLIILGALRTVFTDWIFYLHKW